MMLLVSGATKTMRRLSGDPRLGVLRTPRSGNSIAAIAASGMRVGAENGCFTGLPRAAYVRQLGQLGQLGDRLIFVAAPDVVGDAAATLARFAFWAPALEYYGLPIAFVAQDGLTPDMVPWDQIACLFVGGSTTYKEGDAAAALMREAHARGKWVHVGRVNTLRRYWLLSSLPVDSIDGLSFSAWSDTYIPWMLRRFEGVQHRMELCEQQA